MITQPYPSFIDPEVGGRAKPVSNGTIFIGQNQKDPIQFPEKVYYKDSDGTEIEMAQPIHLNSAGVTVASKNSSTVVIPYTKSASYSILIRNSGGNDRYINESVSGFASDQDVANVAGYPWVEGEISVKDRIYNYQPSDGPSVKVYDPVGGNVLGPEPDYIYDGGSFTTDQIIAWREGGDARGWGIQLKNPSLDQSERLNTYASESPSFNVPADASIFVNDEVKIPHGNVDIKGLITAEGATGSFDSGAVVTIGEYSGAQETEITLKASKGDATLNVASTSNFKVGEVITIYDETDYSFAPHRAYYRAGEHLKISEIVSSTKLRFTESLYDDYDVGIKVFKLNAKKCNVKALNVKCNDEASYCVTMESLFGGVVNTTELSGGKVAALHRNRCYDIRFIKPSSIQNIDDGTATNYAHYTLSCQKVIDESPNVRAFRHALALTGRDQELSIPNRECGSIGGSASTYSSQPGVTAVDFHGCTENCFYDDMDIFGGVNIGGKNNRCRSRIRQQFQPSIIRAGEMVNANHNFSGSWLFTSLAGSQDYGQVIDIGGITNPINDDLKSGGLLDFSEIIIDTAAGNPANASKFIEIANRGYTGNDLEVSFAGAKILNNSGQNNWFRINIGQVISGSAFNIFNLKDVIFDGIALRVLANEVSCEGYKSVGSSQMNQKAVGLEVFVANGFASIGNVQVEDCNLSPLNVRGENSIQGTKRAYLGNVRAVDGNKSSGATTEENSGVALRDLDYAQYNDILTLGLNVDASAVNALRANAVSTLIVGSWHAEGYVNNGLSLAGGTVPKNMQFGNP